MSAPSASADLPRAGRAGGCGNRRRPLSVPADGDAEPEATPAPAVDAEPTVERASRYRGACHGRSGGSKRFPKRRHPVEPLRRASDPAPVVPAEALVSVPEGPAIALTAADGQIGEVTEACGQFGAGASTRGCLQAPDLKTDLAPTEFIEVWRPGRRDDHARKPRHESGPRHRRPQRQPAHAATCGGSRRKSRCGRCRAAPRRWRPEHAGGWAASPTSAGTAAGIARARPATPSARTSGAPAASGSASRPSSACRAPGRPGAANAGSVAAVGRRHAVTVQIVTRTLRAKYIKGRGEGRDRRDREPIRIRRSPSLRR